MGTFKEPKNAPPMNMQHSSSRLSFKNVQQIQASSGNQSSSNQRVNTVNSPQINIIEGDDGEPVQSQKLIDINTLSSQP